MAEIISAGAVPPVFFIFGASAFRRSFPFPNALRSLMLKIVIGNNFFIEPIIDLATSFSSKLSRRLIQNNGFFEPIDPIFFSQTSLSRFCRSSPRPLTPF